MILHEITLNLESLKSATLLLEAKVSLLKGNLSPNTVIGLKCVFGIWALIIIGNVLTGVFELFRRIPGRNKKIKHYQEVVKDEYRLL